MPLERAEVDAQVLRFTERLRALVPVDEVWVYGSYARGNPTDDSDIDVAVVSPALGANRWEDARLIGGAVLPDALFVEAIGFSRDARRSPLRGSLLQEILRTGRRVA